MHLFKSTSLSGIVIVRVVAVVKALASNATSLLVSVESLIARFTLVSVPVIFNVSNSLLAFTTKALEAVVVAATAVSKSKSKSWTAPCSAPC